MMKLNSQTGTAGGRMPVMFVGHGSPMNAIEENTFTCGWRSMAAELEPRAVLCISAHWETRGTKVTLMPRPRTIHDFGGFSSELHAVEYPAPGSPETGRKIMSRVTSTSVGGDAEWGLDHGTWSVLRRMFPHADIPVLQLSLNRNATPQAHYELAKELAFLRREGVLILGSGNLVHNLRQVRWDSGDPYEWASEFDRQARLLMLEGNHAPLLKCEQLSREAKLAIPTREHFIPLLFALALQEPDEQITFYNEQIEMGSLAMRSLVIE